MFTNNYINFQEMRFFYITSSISNNFGKVYKFTGTDGTTLGASSTYTLSAQKFSSQSDIGYRMSRPRCRNFPTLTENNVYCGVYFGSGSTPATKNDYKLESPITSGLTVVEPSPTPISCSENGKYEIMGVYTVTNSSDAEINIWEIGIVTQLCDWNVLMERTVLTEPVTIAPGKTKIINYKLTFNQSVS